MWLVLKAFLLRWALRQSVGGLIALLLTFAVPLAGVLKIVGIPVLIVLAIVGLIAGGVAVYAVPKFKESQLKQAKISAQDLQTIADGWRADNGNDCPTPQRLKAEKQMSAGSNLNDPWGAPWKINCDGDNTTVISFGPDKKEGTADDIHFPPDEQPEK